MKQDNKKVGVVFVAQKNINEPPKIEIEEPIKKDSEITLPLHAFDVMGDDLQLEIHIQDANGANKDKIVQEASLNSIRLSLKEILDTEEESQWPLTGKACVTDPGNAFGCTAFSINKAASVVIETPKPVKDNEGLSGGLPETQQEEDPILGSVRGGGMNCFNSILPAEKEFSFKKGMISLFPFVYLSLFFLLIRFCLVKKKLLRINFRRGLGHQTRSARRFWEGNDIPN